MNTIPTWATEFLASEKELLALQNRRIDIQASMEAEELRHSDEMDMLWAQLRGIERKIKAL